MELKSMKKGDIFRLVLLCCALAFCLVTGVLGLIKRNTNNAFMSLLSVLYVFIPTIAEASLPPIRPVLLCSQSS